MSAAGKIFSQVLREVCSEKNLLSQLDAAIKAAAKEAGASVTTMHRTAYGSEGDVDKNRPQWDHVRILIDALGLPFSHFRHCPDIQGLPRRLFVSFDVSRGAADDPIALGREVSNLSRIADAKFHELTERVEDVGRAFRRGQPINSADLQLGFAGRNVHTIIQKLTNRLQPILGAIDNLKKTPLMGAPPGELPRPEDYEPWSIKPSS